MRERRKAKESRRRVEREEMKKEELVRPHHAVLMHYTGVSWVYQTVVSLSELVPCIKNFAHLQVVQIHIQCILLCNVLEAFRVTLTLR